MSKPKWKPWDGAFDVLKADRDLAGRAVVFEVAGESYTVAWTRKGLIIETVFQDSDAAKAWGEANAERPTPSIVWRGNKCYVDNDIVGYIEPKTDLGSLSPCSAAVFRVTAESKWVKSGVTDHMPGLAREFEARKWCEKRLLEIEDEKEQ